MSETILPILRRHPIMTAAAVILSAAAIPAYSDYQLFLSYGPGGPPYNALGWFFSRCLVTPFRQEMLNTQMYEKRIQMGDTKTYLSFPDGKVPRREGVRPVVGSHAVPQRQINQLPSEEIKKVSLFTICWCLTGKISVTHKTSIRNQ